jgi:hypothetical protein
LVPAPPGYERPEKHSRKNAGTVLTSSRIKNGLVKLTSPLSKFAVNASCETQPLQPVQVGTEHDEQLGGGQYVWTGTWRHTTRGLQIVCVYGT